ncbi:hypothetical protein KFK09_025717 [Dendrobium nobile]|uniref:Uncharacterized protein n=1 Tax=Dendrobium nobile TaxID=94219 RepID=A0A8T3A4K4_DENNO|nr:hypothetical protein KFK09_025717 [Dendrobium nobile]
MVESQLDQCRVELTNKIASASSQNERLDRLHIQLVEAEATNNQQLKNMRILEAENKKLLNKLSKKVAQLSPSAAVDELKKSYTFKIFIEDQVQEACDYFYDVKVKALEAELMQDDFIKGFMKGVRAVQRENGGEIEGLTPSQAYGDHSLDSGGEELERDLQKIFVLRFFHFPDSFFQRRSRGPFSGSILPLGCKDADIGHRWLIDGFMD